MWQEQTIMFLSKLSRIRVFISDQKKKEEKFLNELLISKEKYLKARQKEFGVSHNTTSISL